MSGHPNVPTFTVHSPHGDKCPHCDVLVYSPDGICPACGKTLDVEGHKIDPSEYDLLDYDLARDIEREK